MGITEKLVFHGRVSGNSVVLDGDASALEGHQVIVQLEEVDPKPGSWQAVEKIFGIVNAPSNFDADKVSRDDIYD